MRRAWLLEQVSPYLEYQRKRVRAVLGLEDLRLVKLAEDKLQRGIPGAYAAFGRRHAERERARAEAAGLAFVCVCDPAYPSALRAIPAGPKVLFVAGAPERFLELTCSDSVAIIGARRATSYGTDVARMLARGVSTSGLTVVSGLAIGVDRAAHEGALEGGGRTISVLGGSAAEASPRTNADIHRRIVREGAVISELGPGAEPRKWTFIARNRIIAGLSRLTVVVQARAKSGTNSTIAAAQECGCQVGAVPGSVLSRLSDGPNALLAAGAVAVRRPQDVLDAVFGIGVRQAKADSRESLGRTQQAVLDAIAGGADTMAALARATAQGNDAHGDGAGKGLLVTLAELELAGFVRRTPGGRYATVG